MNHVCMLLRLALAACTLALAACGSTGGLIQSLEDLSTESQRMGLVKIPQYRVASIPGWLPFADVGGLYFYKPSRRPSTVIGISPGDSFELVSEIGGECDLPCLAKIRDKLSGLGTLAQTLVHERIELTRLLADKSAAADKSATADPVVAARTAHKAAQSEFDKNYNEVVEMLKDSGVLIYRWATDSQHSANLGLGPLFSGNTEGEEKKSGFALVSGIRTKTLFVGKDLMKAWPDLNKDSRFSNRFELTTHVMQGKRILYGHVVDISSFAQAKLKASFQQLANLPDTLRALTEIEVGVTLARVSNLSNMGVMGQISRKTMPIAWDAAALQKRLADDNWLTFLSVESDFTDMLELVKNP